MESTVLKILLIIAISKAHSELIAANVTKLQGTSNVLNLTTSQAANTGIPATVAKSAIRSQSKTEADNDFPPPKAISINADNNGGFTVFPVPPNLHFGNGDLEETFTYQVKKQKRPFSIPSDFSNELNFMKHRIQTETYDELRESVNLLHNLMSAKIHNLTVTFDTLNMGAMRNISAISTSLQNLTSEVYNLTTLSKEASRSVKALQYAHDLERTAVHFQLSNLTGQVEKLQNEKNEDVRRVMESLSTLQAKMDNSSQELRRHEAYIRYGQQVMASMKSSIERNDEKIIGLQTDGGPQWAEQTVGCGGVIIANSGIIGYKFRQPYLDNERCVWIIRANRRSKINLQLLDDGFQNQSNSDFLTVTEFSGEEQHPVTLITSSRLEHGNKVLHTFQGPVIFLTFYSDSETSGSGFMLKFDGIGNRTDAATISAIRYTNLHFGGPSGTFKYPKEAGTTYQPNDLVTLVINPYPYDATAVKIHMKTSDLERDEFCEFDSVNFYGSVTGSYALTKRYCHQSEEFNGEIIQSSDGIFLAIFRSDASTQFTGFQFSWEVE